MQIDSQVVQVNLDDIIPNRFQPRIAFDEKALNELAASIKEHGIIQPLVLRKLGNKYEIIAGERRYKAASIAGLTTVPAVLSNIDDNKSAEVALVENIQRRDLTPIEEARSYKNLLDKGYLTQEQLAKKMGLSQSAISNKLRLLNLDIKVQQAILDNQISERHARSLLKLTNPEDQRKWLDRVIKERLTVKKLDELLSKEVKNETQEEVDVPLVETPNIEQIKEQATDINDNKPKNVANMLVSEDTMTEYSNNLPNQEMNNNVQSETLNQMDAPVMPQGPAPVDPFAGMPAANNPAPATGNRFFNPLEENPATMDNLNPFAKDANFTIDNTPKKDEDVEVFDMPGNTPIVEESAQVEPVVQENVAQPSAMPEAAPQVSGPSTIDELNPNNKFFQPIQEQAVSSPMKDTVSEPTTVNPMDNLDVLMNGGANQQGTPADDMSLGDVVTEIRGKVEELNSKGFIISIDEADLENSYQMNISILK